MQSSSTEPASSASSPPGPDVFFGGVSSLSEQLDKPVMLVLRDGRMLVGVLSSFDNFGSLVLERTRERHVAGGLVADVEMGVYLVRGENVALLGEIDEALEAAGAGGLKAAEFEVVRELELAEERARRAAGSAALDGLAE